MIKGSIWVVVIAFSIVVAFCSNGKAEKSGRSTRGTATSFDGVEIVYSVQGKKEPALVFVHGGFADRTFWPDQMKHFARRYKVIAIDLAGHGESGKNRKDWSIDSFAEDMRAVIRKEKITKAVLIGNSLGGPICLKTAHLIPDTYPELMAQAEKIMLNSSPEMAATLMESFADFEMIDLVKNINIPIRCINGDLYPTQLEKNRGIHADFNAVILPNTGHYPMLENPELFNQHLEKILQELEIK